MSFKLHVIPNACVARGSLDASVGVVGGTDRSSGSRCWTSQVRVQHDVVSFAIPAPVVTGTVTQMMVCMVGSCWLSLGHRGLCRNASSRWHMHLQ